MTPIEFIEKWKSVDLKERTAAQSHFNDLCHLLGVADPTTAYPKQTPLRVAEQSHLSYPGELDTHLWTSRAPQHYS